MDCHAEGAQEYLHLLKTFGIEELCSRCDVSTDAARYLASIREGWLKAGHGLNRLTRDVVSRVGNGTPYYETSVRVLLDQA